MTRIIAGLEHVVLVVESSKAGWRSKESLKGPHSQAVAFDPLQPDRAYCAAAAVVESSSSERQSGGVWVSDDAGEHWQAPSRAEPGPNVMALSVSRLERAEEDDDGHNVLYAGTEPSAFFRSSDGGESWERMDALNRLESSESWSFPPRPHTHHVRWIESDWNSPGYVFAAIEAGALVQSHDGGRNWIDRAESGPFDTHTLATHLKARGRLYSAAGDGYFESPDYGKTWRRSMKGLSRHPYCYGLAVDSSDPDAVVISAARGPYEAHWAEGAESLLYRKSAGDDDDNKWTAISAREGGLPEPRGTMITILCGNPARRGEFYAANNRGIFRSEDSGVSWEALEIPWSKEYLSQHAWALAVRPD